MAEEALQLHIEGMAEDGETIPEPSTLEEIMSDPQNRTGVAMLVSIKTEQSKAVRVNVTRLRMCLSRSTDTQRRMASRVRDCLRRLPRN